MITEYQPLGEYGPGGQFPIRRISGSPWVVVDEVWFMKSSQLHSVGIHLDADCPIHQFLGPEAWLGWPNARKLSEWYNARHRKAMRMRERRATSSTREDWDRFENEGLAEDALGLAKMIADDPNSEHQCGRLDWSPSTQVWKDGLRWVKVNPMGVK